jgi:YVTN family beta-propeller protein
MCPVAFTPDGSKAYVGNYGAHWVGVVDVRRHELLKKIQVAAVPGVAKLDPDKYLGEIKGINIAAPSIDGRYLYVADSDLAIVAVVDTREDKVIKTIRVGRAPWRIYMSHDGKYGITVNNGDETISIIDTKSNTVAATLEAGPDMTGVNYAGRKAYVISSTSGFVYMYDMSSLKPAGRLRIGTNIQLETATTDAQDRKIYLAESTNHEVVIIDSMNNSIERGHFGIRNNSTTNYGSIQCPIVPSADDTNEVRSRSVSTMVYFAGAPLEGPFPTCQIAWRNRVGGVPVGDESFSAAFFPPSLGDNRMLSPQGINVGQDVAMAVFCDMPPGLTIKGFTTSMSVAPVSGGF